MLDPATAASADEIFIVRGHPGLVAVAAVAENVVEIGLGQAKAPARQLVGDEVGGGVGHFGFWIGDFGGWNGGKQ